MQQRQIAAEHDDRAPLALAAGLAAALVGGVVWAGMVLFTEYEIGWVAWGIGALVGWAMARTTRQRSVRLAMAAATLAMVGLVAGKGFVVAGSAGAIADELLASPEYLAGAMAWHMYDGGELAPETAEAVRVTDEAGDTLSDALWGQMLSQANGRLAGMTDADRKLFADEIAAGYISQMGMVDGILTQLSGFDLLWVLLAVGTAFQMTNARKEEAEPAVAAESREHDPGL